MLFHTNTSSLVGQPNPLKWVDNTGAVWSELLDILQTFNPERIAVNIDRNIAFGGGLHVGEWEVLQEQLGAKWVQRMVNEPMLGIEFVAGRVSGQIEYYRLMQETTWALIEEAFSERVITPGVTSTEVRTIHFSIPIGRNVGAYCYTLSGRRMVVSGQDPRTKSLHLGSPSRLCLET